MRLFVSGGAPLSRKIAWFFQHAGLRDPGGLRAHRDVGGHLRQSPGEGARSARWARPCPGREVRIAEDGEILVRGGGVMKEYYKNPDATRGGDHGTAGSTRATSAWSIARAISGSPTARRTSSSPPAARTSRRRISRTSSRPTPHLAGDGARRQAEVPQRARHAQRGERAARGRVRTASPQRDGRTRTSKVRARVQRSIDALNAQAGELLHHQEVRHPAGGLDAGGGRAHPDAQGEAEVLHPEVQGRARRVLRRVIGVRQHTPHPGRRASSKPEARWTACASCSSRTTTTTAN